VASDNHTTHLLDVDVIGLEREFTSQRKLLAEPSFEPSAHDSSSSFFPFGMPLLLATFKFQATGYGLPTPKAERHQQNIYIINFKVQ
jgi:hypothetical protein